MLCCAMGVAAVAGGAIGWRRFRRFVQWRLNAQSALAAVVAAMAIATLAAVILDHAGHHAAYAGEPLSTDLGALPLCRGASPEDRVTDITSTQE